MNDFVNLSTSGTEFDKAFNEKLQENESLIHYFEANPEKLKTLSLNPNSKEFSSWICKILEHCQEFDPDFDPSDVVYPKVRPNYAAVSKVSYRRFKNIWNLKLRKKYFILIVLVSFNEVMKL